MDVLGREPTDEESQEFLSSSSPVRRAQWVDAMLGKVREKEKANPFNPFQASKDEAKLRLDAARKEADEELRLLEQLVANHQREHDRLKAMRDKAAASAQEVDRSERELLEARLRLTKARAAIRASQP